MIGAIIGDVIGSVYEFNNIKTKDFPLFNTRSIFTDDSVMTIAVAKALLRSREEKTDFRIMLVEEMQSYGKQYPNAGYGGMFRQWLHSDQPKPYNSFGNGSAMRVSPCGLIAVELAEALSLAKASAEVTHNHPEGIKGAQAVAGAIYLAKNKKKKEEIKKFVESNFYDLDFTLNDIRPTYYFNETCQETVPQAIVAFLESTDYEDAIRNAVSLGGDSDTLAAITGSIALAYYREINRDALSVIIPADKSNLINHTIERLPDDFKQVIESFNEVCFRRAETYSRRGFCSPIKHINDNSDKLSFSLVPETKCATGNSLKERIAHLSRKEIVHRFCSDESYVHILLDMKIGVVNYNDHFETINAISKDMDCLRTASLEECLLYLTFLWRLDYHEGGYPDFDYRHREEIRLAKIRIIELLFSE